MSLTVGTLVFDAIALVAVLGLVLFAAVRRFWFQFVLIRMVFRSWPYAIVIVDSAGIIRLFDRKAEQLFGYREKDVRGKALEILLPINRRGGHTQVHLPAFFAQPTARQMGAGLDLNIRNSSGVHVPVDVSLSPVVTSRGLFVVANVQPRMKEHS
jgi:PAS domain S-box-containing protein